MGIRILKRFLVLLVVVVFALPLTTLPVIAQDVVDEYGPRSASTYFVFGSDLPAYEYVYFTTTIPIDLTLGLRDCCIRDDVVEVRINGCFVWTVDSSNGASGSHPWQYVTLSLCPGTYEIELRNTISSVGPSGWYYDLIIAAFTGQYRDPCLCLCSEEPGTRTVGFYKNHPDVVNEALPITIAGEEVTDYAGAIEIIKNRRTHLDRLKSQLMVTKLNVAVFGISCCTLWELGLEGDEPVCGVIARAEELLNDPDATKDELSAMQDLLDMINNSNTYVPLPD